VLGGSSHVMKELIPRRLDPDAHEPQGSDDLWSEVLSTLALVGSVLLLVLLISLFGRL
jgi:hypothetical protein